MKRKNGRKIDGAWMDGMMKNKKWMRKHEEFMDEWMEEDKE